VLRHLGVDHDTVTLSAFAAGFALRLLAIWRGWGLPTFSYQQQWD
jgi:uncharacterized membrane protein YeiH